MYDCQCINHFFSKCCAGCELLFIAGGDPHYVSSFGVPIIEVFWLNQVRCNGREQLLTDCPASDWGAVDPCNQFEAAGATCTGPLTLPRMSTDSVYSRDPTHCSTTYCDLPVCMLCIKILFSIENQHILFLYTFCTAFCVQGDIRLVGGPDERQGRIELCYNEAWGTVCSDNFYAHDATVACVQLGFSGVGEFIMQTYPVRLVAT